jgi:hypothetical protein
LSQALTVALVSQGSWPVQGGSNMSPAESTPVVGARTLALACCSRRRRRRLAPCLKEVALPAGTMACRAQNQNGVCPCASLSAKLCIYV